VPLIAALALGACRQSEYLDRRDTIRLGAGDAAAHNRAVHTIDPWPVHAKNKDLPADGKRMMVGIKRYQENRSIEPEGSETADEYKPQSKPEDPGGAGAPASQ